MIFDKMIFFFIYFNIHLFSMQKVNNFKILTIDKTDDFHFGYLVEEISEKNEKYISSEESEKLDPVYICSKMNYSKYFGKFFDCLEKC